MQTLTIGAASFASACDYLDALRPFGPSLVIAGDGTYRVRISLDARDRSIVQILDAVEDHVTARGSGLELDGYLLNL